MSSLAELRSEAGRRRESRSAGRTDPLRETAPGRSAHADPPLWSPAMTRTSGRSPLTIRAHFPGFRRFQEITRTRLHTGRRHLADFIEENRAADGGFELADLVAIRAGETPLHVARHKPDSSKVSAKCPPPVDGHEEFLGARTSPRGMARTQRSPCRSRFRR